MSLTCSFSYNTLEDVVDKRIHHSHCFAGNSGVGVHLFQNFVDVNAKASFVPPPALLFAVDGTVLATDCFAPLVAVIMMSCRLGPSYC